MFQNCLTTCYAHFLMSIKTLRFTLIHSRFVVKTIVTIRLIMTIIWSADITKLPPGTWKKPSWTKRLEFAFQFPLSAYFRQFFCHFSCQFPIFICSGIIQPFFPSSKFFPLKPSQYPYLPYNLNSQKLSYRKAYS